VVEVVAEQVQASHRIQEEMVVPRLRSLFSKPHKLLVVVAAVDAGMASTAPWLAWEDQS